MNVGSVVGSRQPPASTKRRFHYCRWKSRTRAITVVRERFLGKVVNNVRWLRSCQKADYRTITEETQISIVRNDVHRGIPGNLRRRRSAGPNVVHCTDVAAIE